VLGPYDFDLIVDPRTLRHLEYDVPQRGPSYSSHRQPRGQADNSLREVNLLRFAAEEECAVPAFHNGDFATCQELVYRRFVHPALLLQLIDSEATRAAPGRPVLVTSEGLSHWA
jgi:hypothetical protein